MAIDRDGRRAHVRRHTDRGWSETQHAVLAGAVAGLAGGLAAAWTMNRFQALWSKVAEGYRSDSAGGSEDARDWQERGEDANATERAAQVIARTTIDRTLTREELKVAAPAVHYAFGGTMGALYGALAELMPSARSMQGVAYGTAVWAGADEVAVPWLGLSRSDNEYPLELHLQSLAAHIVYGVTTEAVRRAIREFVFTPE